MRTRSRTRRQRQEIASTASDDAPNTSVPAFRDTTHRSIVSTGRHGGSSSDDMVSFSERACQRLPNRASQEDVSSADAGRRISLSRRKHVYCAIEGEGGKHDSAGRLTVGTKRPGHGRCTVSPRHTHKRISPSHSDTDKIVDDNSSRCLKGYLGLLPREALEQILGYLDTRDLATMEATCRYFIESGITEQVARHHLKSILRAKAMKPSFDKGESYVMLLDFMRSQSAAAAQGTAVSMGSYHSLCLFYSDEGSMPEYGMYSFGRGFHGQLGRGDHETMHTPSRVDVLEANGRVNLYGDNPANVRLAVVHTGSHHSIAVSRKGEVFTWGLASSGELGHGGWTPTELTIPRLISNLGRTRIVSICAGSNHSLAISQAGQLWSCGRGRHGELGLGHFHDEPVFNLIDSIQYERIVSASAGKFHSMALAADGKLFTWGSNKYGQLGFVDGGNPQMNCPEPQLLECLHPQRLDSCDRVTAISAGGYHSMVLTVSGNILGAGLNKDGQLGIPALTVDLVRQFTPICLMNEFEYTLNPLHRVIQVQCGHAHTLLLVQSKGRKEVRAAGDNSYGQLGTGSLDMEKTFTLVKKLQFENICCLCAGDWHSGAVSTTGKLFTWGRGDCGQLGHGDDKSRWSPKEVVDFKVIHPDKTLRRSKKAPKKAIVLSSPAPEGKPVRMISRIVQPIPMEEE